MQQQQQQQRGWTSQEGECGTSECGADSVQNGSRCDISGLRRAAAQGCKVQGLLHRAAKPAATGTCSSQRQNGGLEGTPASAAIPPPTCAAPPPAAPAPWPPSPPGQPPWHPRRGFGVAARPRGCAAAASGHGCGHGCGHAADWATAGVGCVTAVGCGWWCGLDHDAACAPCLLTETAWGRQENGGL